MTTIIGIDCATQPKNVGLALARHDRGRVMIEATEVGSKERPPEMIIADWLVGVDTALLALDAPLGWPSLLGSTLAGHRAGERLQPDADQLFHRDTDDHVHEVFRKRPLEVGANLIARTARAALELLEVLRRTLGHPIPLAWDRGALSGIQAIEVYPAATWLARRKGEKKGWTAFGHLGGDVESVGTLAIPTSDHARDAVVCAVAGADFLTGAAVPPRNPELAKKEGWIWVRDPNWKEP